MSLGFTACRPPGFGSSAPELVGTLVDDHRVLGHRLRDGNLPTAGSFEPVELLILGAGVAGLSAAWACEHAGHSDYRVPRAGPRAGGDLVFRTGAGVGLPLGSSLRSRAPSPRTVRWSPCSPRWVRSRDTTTRVVPSSPRRCCVAHPRSGSIRTGGGSRGSIPRWGRARTTWPSSRRSGRTSGAGRRGGTRRVDRPSPSPERWVRMPPRSVRSTACRCGSTSIAWVSRRSGCAGGSSTGVVTITARA